MKTLKRIPATIQQRAALTAGATLHKLSLNEYLVKAHEAHMRGQKPLRFAVDVVPIRVSEQKWKEISAEAARLGMSVENYLHYCSASLGSPSKRPDDANYLPDVDRKYGVSYVFDSTKIARIRRWRQQVDDWTPSKNDALMVLERAFEAFYHGHDLLAMVTMLRAKRTQNTSSRMGALRILFEVMSCIRAEVYQSRLVICGCDDRGQKIELLTNPPEGLFSLMPKDTPKPEMVRSHLWRVFCFFAVENRLEKAALELTSAGVDWFHSERVDLSSIETMARIFALAMSCIEDVRVETAGNGYQFRIACRAAGRDRRLVEIGPWLEEHVTSTSKQLRTSITRATRKG